MISPRDGPCDQVFVGNEMGNLYALRDLDGDGRVFGDQEATGVQRATGNGDEMVVFYGMKWCFLFFSDEIMFLFFCEELMNLCEELVILARFKPRKGGTNDGFVHKMGWHIDIIQSYSDQHD